MHQAREDSGVRLQLTARFESDIQLAAGSLTALETLVDAFLGPDRGPAFSLACHEAVMNAIIHSHGGDRSRFVTLELFVRDTQVEARIRDEGGNPAVAARYDSALTNPYLGKDISELPESGVGAWLIQQGADHVAYEYGPNGGCLVLRVAVGSHALPV